MRRSRPSRPSRRPVLSTVAVAVLVMLAALSASAPLVEAQQVQQQQQQQQQGRQQQQQQQQEERQAAMKKAEQDRAEAEARRAQRRAEAETERRQREEEGRKMRRVEADMERAVREGDQMREKGERLLQQAERQRKQQQQQQQQQNMGTVELRASNFDASVRDGSAWLVEFYAPWCGHCKRFAPTYEKVAETLHAQSKADLAADPAARTVKVAKVDGSADRALASRFNIRGYPTFFLVDGWDVYEYEGDRTLEDLVDFVTEDYVDYEPLPFLNSPFGPMGQLRAFFILAGSAAVSSFNWMVKEKGFSEVVAAMIMMGVAISIGLFLIIFIGLLSVAKPKTD